MITLLKKANIVDSKNQQLKENSKVSFIFEKNKAPLTGIITEVIGTSVIIKANNAFYLCDSTKELTKVN